MTFYEQNIFPTTMNRNLWRIHDKSPMTSQVWNTQALDLSIGTGAGFVCGYDTGGLKITASSPPSSGLSYNSGVYYVRTAETIQNVNHHGAYRICIPEVGTFNLHPYDDGATGWSMIYVGYDGKIGEYIGNDTGGYVYGGTGGGWNYPNNKVLLARIARDNVDGTGNAFPQAKIVDERQFVTQINDSYTQPSGDYMIPKGYVPLHKHSGNAGDGGDLSNMMGIALASNYNLAGGATTTVLTSSGESVNATDLVLVIGSASVNNTSGGAATYTAILTNSANTQLAMTDNVATQGTIANTETCALTVVWVGTASLIALGVVKLRITHSGNGTVIAGAQLVKVKITKA